MKKSAAGSGRRGRRPLRGGTGRREGQAPPLRRRGKCAYPPVAAAPLQSALLTVPPEGEPRATQWMAPMTEGEMCVSPSRRRKLRRQPPLGKGAKTGEGGGLTGRGGGGKLKAKSMSPGAEAGRAANSRPYGEPGWKRETVREARVLRERNAGKRKETRITWKLSQLSSASLCWQGSGPFSSSGGRKSRNRRRPGRQSL